MAKKEELNYTAAYEELTDIVEQIEGEEISVDDLAEKMKRAAFLIKFCSGKLRDTEDAVERIIRDMEEPGPISPEEESNEPF